MGDYITYVHERGIRIPEFEMSPLSPAVASSNRTVQGKPLTMLQLAQWCASLFIFGL